MLYIMDLMVSIAIVLLTVAISTLKISGTLSMSYWSIEEDRYSMCVCGSANEYDFKGR